MIVRLVGGPFDGLKREVDIPEGRLTLELPGGRIVHRYQYAAADTYTFAGSAVTADPPDRKR